MGKVYLVGAGPGAADLITLRGADLLKRADIVFHDALVQPEMLALAVKAKLVAVGNEAIARAVCTSDRGVRAFGRLHHGGDGL